MKKKDLKVLEEMASMLTPRLEHGFTGKASISGKNIMSEHGYMFVNHFNALKKMVARHPHKSVIDIFKEYYVINKQKIKAFNAKHPGKFDEIIEELKKKALEKSGVTEKLDDPCAEVLSTPCEVELSEPTFQVSR